MSALSDAGDTLQRAHVFRLQRSRGDLSLHYFEDQFASADKSTWQRYDVVVCVFTFVDFYNGQTVDGLGYAALYDPELPTVYAHGFGNPLRLPLAVTDQCKNAFDHFGYVLRACRLTNVEVIVHVGITDGGLPERVGRVNPLAATYEVLFNQEREPDMIRVIYSDNAFTIAWRSDYDLDSEVPLAKQCERHLSRKARDICDVARTVALEHRIQDRRKVCKHIESRTRYVHSVMGRYDQQWNSVYSQLALSPQQIQTTLVRCSIDMLDSLMIRCRRMKRQGLLASDARIYPLIDREPPAALGDGPRWLFGSELRPPRLIAFLIGVVLALHTKLTHFELLFTVQWVPETRILATERLDALVMAIRQSILRAVVRHDAPYKNTRQRIESTSKKLNPIDNQK